SRQEKNAFCTRTRSYTPSAGTMDDEGIQKGWNTNVRTKPARSTDTRMVMAVSASARFHRRRRRGLVPAGSASAGSAMPGLPVDHLRAAHGGGDARNGLRRTRPAVHV